jgi:hypothetical protein
LFISGLVPEVHDEAEAADAQRQQDGDDDGRGDSRLLRVVQRLSWFPATINGQIK